MKKILILSCLLLFGCATVSTNYQADTSVVIQVDSDNYEIVGDIKGEATGDLIILGWIPLPFGDNGHYGRVQTSLYRSLSKGYVYDMAMYNAIENANDQYPGGVDAIITPQYTSSISGLPPFWWKLEVKIKGKGIRFVTAD